MMLTPLRQGLLGLFLLTSLTACKYEDGPLMSLSSPANRVANTWEVDRATDASGEDVTDDFDTWEFVLADDGTAEITSRVVGITIRLTGEWNLLDRDRNLQLLTKDPTGLITFNSEFVITRLTRAELWLQDIEEPMRTFELEVK